MLEEEARELAKKYEREGREVNWVDHGPIWFYYEEIKEEYIDRREKVKHLLKLSDEEPKMDKIIRTHIFCKDGEEVMTDKRIPYGAPQFPRVVYGEYVPITVKLPSTAESIKIDCTITNPEEK